MCVFFVFTGPSWFVLGLVVLCLVYFVFVVVWLSAPVQSIAWRDSFPKWPVVSCGTLNPTHSLALSLTPFYNIYSVPPLDNIWVMVIVWRIRGNIIRTTLCWIMWHNVHSQQHTYMSSSYRSNRLGLSHWDPYAVFTGGCVELYHCNIMECFSFDSSLISTTNWFPSVLWHCWFGHLACKNRPRNDL